MDKAGSDRTQRRTALVGRTWPIQSRDCSSEWDSPCRRRAFKRSLCWLHFILEWTQGRRAAWSRSRIRHQVTPRQQVLRTSKRHKWPPDDAETSLILQEAFNNCQCLCTHNDQPGWGQRQVLWWSGFCDFCSTPSRQTHPPRGLQWQSGHRPPNLGRSDWNWRSREVQQQWPIPFKEVCRAWTTDHQHSLPSTNSTQKDIMDASSLQTLSSHWLYHSAKKGQTGCQSDKDYVWCRLLDRSQASC